MKHDIANATMTLTLDEIAHHEQNGNPGYSARIESLGDAVIKCGEELTFKIADFLAVSGMDSAQEVTAVPLEQWPWTARALRKFRIESDRGVGDVVARFTHATTVDRAVAGIYRGIKLVPWLSARLPPCGCADRHARLNAWYPFD